MPDAFFRYIFRQTAGKAIEYTADETTPIGYTNDSWASRMLCGECESFLNEQFDAYGIAVLQGRIGNVTAKPGAVHFSNVDSDRFRMFFLSILWRMTMSLHPSYDAAELPYQIQEMIREAMLKQKSVSHSVLQVRLRRLIDSHPNGTLSMEALRSFVAAPYRVRHETYNTIGYFCFGFLVEISVPRAPTSERYSSGTLCKGTMTFVVPTIDFTKVLPLFEGAVGAVRKKLNGLSRITAA